MRAKKIFEDEEFTFIKPSERIKENAKLRDKFVDALYDNDIETFKDCINKGFDPSYNNNEPIRMASMNGNLEIVKILMSDQRVNPAGYTNGAFWLAYDEGHKDVVELLFNDERVQDKLTGYKIEEINRFLYES